MGNFPEIEVYVVISCYNYSLYSLRDFCRLVVTPADLEIAFGGAGIEDYQFDLSAVSLKNGYAYDNKINENLNEHESKN